jgi:hypothetical protein
VRGIFCNGVNFGDYLIDRINDDSAAVGNMDVVEIGVSDNFLNGKVRFSGAEVDRNAFLFDSF